MNVKIKDMTWDTSIYPRTTKSWQTISAYAEALAAGAAFPPIKIQRVFNYADGQTATLVLDGTHRCEAFQKGLGSGFPYCGYWGVKYSTWSEFRGQAWSEFSIDRQNHDLDVTTICATIKCHDRQHHEILCRL